MPKPDILTALVRPSDGTVFTNPGDGLRECQVKGASSEILASAQVVRDTDMIEIDSLPYRHNIKVVFDVMSDPGVASNFSYNLNFNDDFSDSYFTVGMGLREHVVLGRFNGRVTAPLQAYGTVSFSNRDGWAKLGNGMVTLSQGSAVGLGLAFPSFKWLDEENLIQKITLTASRTNGSPLPDHVFKVGSMVRILGRNLS